MAQFIELDPLPPSYRGARRILQFTNWDGRLVRFNCGQAAAATLLTFHGLLPPVEENAGEVMCRIESAHPPDIVGGWLGSSLQRVARICRAGGLPISEVEGEEGLREQISRRRTALVMLEVPGPSLFSRWTVPTGHWMVAYGFDDEDVYLTNWGKMNWDVFRQRSQALIPRLIGMRDRCLAADF